MTSPARDRYDDSNYYVTSKESTLNRKQFDDLFAIADRSPFPHVIGYYELELTRSFPKNAKRNVNGGGNTNGGSSTSGANAVRNCNPSVEQLRSAIVRLTQSSVDQRPITEDSRPTNVVPLSWVRFVRHLESIVDKEPTMTCLPMTEVIAIARSFDVSPTETYQACVYFERRGILFVGAVDSRKDGTEAEMDDDGDPLSRVVVIGVAWLFRTIGRVLQFIDASTVREREVTAILAADSPYGKELERQLMRAGLLTAATRSQWLLGILRSFGLCVPIGGELTLSSSPPISLPVSPSSSLSPCRIYLFPTLLEAGSPNAAVWPETPNCDEKQVTCEVTVRRLKPSAFAEFQQRLASGAGQRQLGISGAPPIAFMSHHVVFTTLLDCGNCPDCFRIRRRTLVENNVGQHQQQRGWIDEPRTVTMTSKANEASACGGCSNNTAAVAVHRVHIELSKNFDFIRIGVRGDSPCCIMRAVVDFIDLNIDDYRPSPLRELPPKVAISSNLVDDASCVSSASTIRVKKPAPPPPLPPPVLMSKSVNESWLTSSRWSYNRQDSSSRPASCQRRLLTRSSSRVSIRGSEDSPSDFGALDDDQNGFDDDVDDDDDIGSAEYQLQSDDDPEIGGGDGVGERRRLFVICPKCVLVRLPNPERMEYPKRRSAGSSSFSSAAARRRKPICSKWHNLGSWARVVTGDYRPTLRGVGIDVPSAGGMTLPNCGRMFSPAAAPSPSAGLFFGTTGVLPDHEHPRLVLVLPPGERLSAIDWYLFSRARFVDGFDVHFMCEYTGYWHFVSDGGVEYRLGGGAAVAESAGVVNASTSSGYRGGARRPGCSGSDHQLPGALLRLAIPMIQCLRGVGEHALNVKMLAPVIGDLLDSYDGGSGGDGSGFTGAAGGNSHHTDPATWLITHKDRLVSMFTKILISAFYSETIVSSPAVIADIYSKCSTPISADSVFQSSSSSFSRSALARYIRVDASTSTGGAAGNAGGRFGGLRPVVIGGGREVRWVCRMHYDELKTLPASPASSTSLLK